MEALTMASRLWTGIEKVTIISSFCDPIFYMVSRSGIKISYLLRAPCAQTNPPSKPSWRQRPFCQSCSSPTCCEEAQKAKQRKQKVCSSQTLKREGANCLCAWYRSQPPGSAGFPI